MKHDDISPDENDVTIFIAIDDKKKTLHYYEVSRSLAEAIPSINTTDYVARYRRNAERPEYYNKCYFNTLCQVEPAMKAAGIFPETDEFEVKLDYEKDLENELLNRGVAGKDARFLSNSNNVDVKALLEAIAALTPEETVVMTKDIMASPDPRAAVIELRTK